MNFPGLKITSSIAATAFLAGPQDLANAATDVDNRVEVSIIQSPEIEPVQLFAEIEDESTSTRFISIPAEPEWDETSQGRFEELVEALAVHGQLSRTEEREFRSLKALRRKTHPSRTYEDIVADQELHEKVATAIEGLRNLINYATATSFPASSYKNRS